MEYEKFFLQEMADARTFVLGDPGRRHRCPAVILLPRCTNLHPVPSARRTQANIIRNNQISQRPDDRKKRDGKYEQNISQKNGQRNKFVMLNYQAGSRTKKKQSNSA
jgi:hypothetical protein